MSERPIMDIEVSTVQEMRDALAGFPGDMALTDVFNEVVKITQYEDTDTGDRYLIVE